MAPIQKHLETDLENVHSLPGLEEARTQTIIASGGNKYSGKKKRTIALIVVLVAVIATAVGFTIAVTQNKRGESQANSLASSNENDDGDADQGDDENVVNDDGTDETDDGETDDIERFDKVKEFLINSEISSATSLQTTSTPQYQAAIWISNDDERELDIPESYDEEEAYKFVQRYVMAVFYFALNGPNWTRKVSFLTGEATCDWNFDLSVSDPVPGSDQTDYDYGVSCWDEDANEYSDAVTWIFMPDNNLVGSLPSEIGSLEYLNHLSLFGNKISGSIPDSFQYLQNLNFVNMNSNQISGPLPDWINELPELQYLALGDNEMSGALPSFQGSALIELALDSNNFEGTIDSLDDAVFLEVVYLNNNTFSGQLTEDTWVDLLNSDLRIADLSSNQLTGSFPSYFYWLEEIDLSYNKLSGAIAAPVDDDEEEDLPTIRINLSENDLSGSIPTEIDKLLSLISFDVSGNALVGPLPEQLGNLQNLESLYLSYNPGLTAGPIPDLRDCQALTEISLASTQRTGTIPIWIGSALSNLELLDLHSNRLDETIPSNLGLLDSLSVLMLNRNLLTGTVPTELAKFGKSRNTFLDNNDLSGSMEPICDADDEDLVLLSADTTVLGCDNGCCSSYCASGDDACNKPNSTVVKFDYNFISRTTYSFSENFKLADVDSP